MKPQNYSVGEYKGKYVVTTNKRASFFAKKSDDFKVIGYYLPDGSYVKSDQKTFGNLEFVNNEETVLDKAVNGKLSGKEFNKLIGYKDVNNSDETEIKFEAYQDTLNAYYSDGDGWNVIEVYDKLSKPLKIQVPPKEIFNKIINQYIELPNALNTEYVLGKNLNTEITWYKLK